MAPPASPLLAGSSDPQLVVPGWVELAVGPLTRLEPELTRLPTMTSDCTPLIVFVIRTLMSSLLSLISTTFFVLGVVAFAFPSWMLPTKKSSWNGNATFGSTCFFVICLGWLFWAKSFTQSCCSNSTMADTSYWALGDMTALRLESQVQSLISWRSTWLKALSDSLRNNLSVPGLVSFQ